MVAARIESSQAGPNQIQRHFTFADGHDVTSVAPDLDHVRRAERKSGGKRGEIIRGHHIVRFADAIGFIRQPDFIVGHCGHLSESNGANTGIYATRPSSMAFFATETARS